MAIEFLCPSCNSGLRVGDDNAGKVVRCGSCMATVRVPESAPVAREAVPEADEPFPRPRSSRRAVEPVAPPPSSDRPRPRPRRRPPPPRTKGRGVVFWILITMGILGVLGVATCAGVAVMFQPKWRTHTSQPGGFRVDLPGPPRPDIRNLTRLNNKPEHEVEGTVLLFAGEEFVVIYSDIDKELRKLSDKEILKSVEDGLKRDDPLLTVKSAHDLTLTGSGFPARELHLSHPEGTAVCRIVVAESRVYLVIGGSRERNADTNPKIRRFIDSFDVTDSTLIEKYARRKQREKESADAEAAAELEELRTELRETGELLAERIVGKAEALHERIREALEEERADLTAAGRTATRITLGVVDRERSLVLKYPDRPVAPPPRPRVIP